MSEENKDAMPLAPAEGAEARAGSSSAEAPAAQDLATESGPLSNSQKVIEWMGLYYSLCTGVTPPWLTVDAGGFKEVSFNLGNILVTGVGALIGYLWGRAGVAVGRVAVRAATGV